MATKQDIELLRARIENQTQILTVRLGSITAVWAGVLFALLKLTD